MLIRLIIAVAIIGQSAAAAFADAPLTVLNDCVRQGAAKPDPDSPFSEATRRKLTLATCMTLQGYKPKPDGKNLDSTECYQSISQGQR
jgi:hypothetical protein